MTPSWRSSSRLSQTVCLVAESSPVVGSSRNRSLGVFTRAAPISQRRFCPPERCSYRLPNSGKSPSFSPTLPMLSLSLPPFRPYREPLTVRFSCTVSLLSRQLFCHTTPIWRRMASSSLPSLCPQTAASPAVGASRVHSMLMVVDFPAPFTPRKPNSSPCST